MAIIIRFVDREGILRERFFTVIIVTDTCSQTLKDKIIMVFAQYNLQLENIRGQGYDGASNMSGQINVLSILTIIFNFVDSSAKRHSMLKACREEEISDLVAAGTLETGSGKNQATTLERAKATRWGSHLRSISSLLKFFKATQSTIDDLYLNGVDKVQGEAKAVGKALKKFNFVYCLHMMHDIMRTTDFLCQTLQKKDIGILNAIHSISIVKAKLQDLRDKGWDNLIEKVTTFCCEHDIPMPNLTAPYRKSRRDCEKDITNECYYRFNIFYCVIDFQLSELDSRFTENSKEILTLGGSFDPRHNFRAFKLEDMFKKIQDLKIQLQYLIRVWVLCCRCALNLSINLSYLDSSGFNSYNGESIFKYEYLQKQTEK
ncbi:uncharacterized protein LOC141630427 [Silene latifolia]|uniref:uncharacterized protein LOC141630427 n=1 Tax=Silene latifolia TaxID=37657 RepID=UPI003D77258C